jgi:hypothetical protein
MDNKNTPAFPLPVSANEDGIYTLLDAGKNSNLTGLSKREMFAMAAMQGILSNHWCQNDYKNHIDALSYSEVASQAVGYADALLNELSKPQP